MKKLITVLMVVVFAVMAMAGCSTPAVQDAVASAEQKVEAAVEEVKGKAEAAVESAKAAVEAPAAAPASEAPAASAELPKVKIGWAPPAVTGVFKTAFEYMEKAAAEAKNYGIEVEIITKSGEVELDDATQIANIENLVQSGCDVIMISPSNTAAVTPAINAAKEAGVGVIVVNMLEEIDGANVDAYIGFDNKVAGKISGYAALNSMGGPGVLNEGDEKPSPETYLDLAWWDNMYKDADLSNLKGKVAIIEGISGSMYSNQRVEGVREALALAPGVEEVQLLAADWERQKAVSAAENILQANPELDAIVAVSAEMEFGAISAVESAGRQDEVKVIGNDGTPESIEAIKAGKLTAETWHGFPEWGWYGVEIAVKLAYGEQVEKLVDVLPRTEYIGNADTFYPNPVLKPIDWEKIIADKAV